MTKIKPVSYILEELESKDKESVELVKKAYEFAKKAHEGQKRYSGEPYITHPIEVARSLAEIGMDAKIVAAGLLHDSLEDSEEVTEEILEKEFGKEIAFLVEGVTKLGHVRYHGLKRHTESLRKLFAATSEDIRVMIIKLFDRLHNAKTLEFVPEHKRKRIALETLELYAPIAERLGMGQVQRELQEAAFPFAYPKEYERVKKIFNEMKGSEKRLEKIHKSIKKKLAEYGIKNFTTQVRVKSLYSLWKKLERKNWDTSKIYDIWALRIILDSVQDCYNVLGIIHAEYKPIPGRIKDYIAFPKPNGYQSIHTTVHTGDGHVLEIQIRTYKMHKEAQLGLAAHFSYKEFGASKPKKSSAFEWIRQFVPQRFVYEKEAEQNKASLTYKTSIPEWIKSIAQEHIESEEDYKAIKNDFFAHRIFVFTPKGDVVDLPIGATPIDFAYAIHTDIGNHISAAKVNGKLVSLESELQNGDIVEILTNKKAHPTEKWLNYAKTRAAKQKIRSYLQKRLNKTN